MTKEQIFNLAFPNFDSFGNLEIEVYNKGEMIYMVAYSEVPFKEMKRFFVASFYNDLGLNLIYSASNIIDRKINIDLERVQNSTKGYLEKLLRII